MQCAYNGDTSSSSSSGLSSKISATGDIGLGGMICFGTDPWAQQSVEAGSGSTGKCFAYFNINDLIKLNSKFISKFSFILFFVPNYSFIGQEFISIDK